MLLMIVFIWCHTAVSMLTSFWAANFNDNKSLNHGNKVF